MRSVIFGVCAVFVLLVSGILDGRAYAYLDPGTGSYMFQLLIAAVIGGLFALKLSWNKIAFFFRNLFSKKKPK